MNRFPQKLHSAINKLEIQHVGQSVLLFILNQVNLAKKNKSNSFIYSYACVCASAVL